MLTNHIIPGESLCTYSTLKVYHITCFDNSQVVIVNLEMG